MHLLLTDRLACPRCGPAFGLILRSDRLADRRVEEGELGCANCRERYPVRKGVADLRPPPREPAPTLPAPAPADATELAVAVAAAMGAGEGRGHVLLVGGAAAWAGAVAGVLPQGLEVVTAREGLGPAPEPTGVSPVLVGDTLPFFDATFAGVAVAGPHVPAGVLREGVRVLARSHRLAWVDPPDDARVRLGGVGLTRFASAGGLAAGGR